MSFSNCSFQLRLILLLYLRLQFAHTNSVSYCCKKLLGAFRLGDTQKLDDVSYVSPISGHFDLISKGMKLYKNKNSKLYLTRDNDGNWVIGTFDNGDMPMIIGKNCRKECPENCTWQMWDYKLEKWIENDSMRFSCASNSVDEIPKDLDSQLPFLNEGSTAYNVIPTTLVTDSDKDSKISSESNFDTNLENNSETTLTRYRRSTMQGRSVLQLISPDRLRYSPIKSLRYSPISNFYHSHPIKHHDFEIDSINANAANPESIEINLLNRLAFESLIRIFQQIQQDTSESRSYLLPPRKKLESFCDYRGCINKIRMKKSEQTGPTNYVEKLLAWVRKRMAELKETPDKDRKKKILQRILSRLKDASENNPLFQSFLANDANIKRTNNKSVDPRSIFLLRSFKKRGATRTIGKANVQILFLLKDLLRMHRESVSAEVNEDYRQRNKYILKKLRYEMT